MKNISFPYENQIITIIQKHLPSINILLYGSRIQGKSHEGSDVDIALQTLDHSFIPLSKIARLKEELEDSSIPLIIDIHDYYRLPESFQKEINHHALKLKESSPS